MRSIVASATFVAVLAALPSAPAPGQPQPLTSTTAAPAPAQEPKPAATAKHRTWLKADARVCLEFPTDMQVVKCSEKYR
jgi:hypothetical protein